MCGILGLIGKEPVADRLIKGAGRLQNRGERSTRVVTYDMNFFYSHGGTKPPTLQFFDFDPSNLRGTMGIVHTRYATSGANTPDMLERNIQPVLSDRPGMATCNNGDLVNLFSQVERLRQRGFSFQTQVDAKVIQNTLIYHMINNKAYKYKGSTTEFVSALFQSVEQMHQELVGAYSVLCIMESGLVAFKDPRGIRPLCMAHRRDEQENIIEYAFSSESSVFNYFGDYHGINELEPGEVIFIDHETFQKFQYKSPGSQEKFCFFEFIYFARPDTRFKGRVVEVVRQDLGAILAEECGHLKDRIDVVCGLPGTAVSTGIKFAQKLNLQYRRAIIKVDNKRSFQETSDIKRQKAIDEKFIFLRDFIEGKSIAVIDDSNVRGTTAKKIVRRMFELGAREVHMIYYCPPIIGPCFYGIDTPDETKLLAWNRTIDKIKDEMGCTTVTYISKEGLIRGLKVPEDELCLACITREYPTDVSEAQNRIRGRIVERELSDRG